MSRTAKNRCSYPLIIYRKTFSFSSPGTSNRIPYTLLRTLDNYRHSHEWVHHPFVLLVPGVRQDRRPLSDVRLHSSLRLGWRPIQQWGRGDSPSYFLTVVLPHLTLGTLWSIFQDTHVDDKVPQGFDLFVAVLTPTSGYGFDYSNV